jgi:hypothetical protein
MLVSDLDQEILDLDWFALDVDGAVGHFATAGAGALPEPLLSMTKQDFDFIQNYFETLFVQSTGLKSYLDAARIGLFEFDALRAECRPVGYFRVSLPSVPLLITKLPPDIAGMLSKTVLPVSFRRTEKIPLELIAEI